jgi:hypothetical protein
MGARRNWLFLCLSGLTPRGKTKAKSRRSAGAAPRSAPAIRTSPKKKKREGPEKPSLSFSDRFRTG